MATYTKETALYDTGAIADDIGQAGETASKYITAVDQNGIKVHAENNVNVDYTVINAEGMEVYNDSISVAKFGAVTRVGTEDDASITIDSNSITGVGGSGKEFFTFADSSTVMDVSRSYFVNRAEYSKYPHDSNSGLSVTLPVSPLANTEVVVDFNILSSWWSLKFTKGTSASKHLDIGQSKYTCYVTYDGDKTFTNIYIVKKSQSASSATIIRTTIIYHVSETAPSYKLGGNVSADGGYALAEGYSTKASGDYSHAEGYSTEAAGNSSHAEGDSTVASGTGSHAEGVLTVASGSYSHAQGECNTASGRCQSVIGSFNVPETVETPSTKGTYLFIIGNGDSSSQRSNAFTVDWDGNVNIASGGKYKINGNNLSASDVGAVPTERTVNGKALSANIADADYVTDAGTSGSWTYRKWNSGKVEAWCGYSFASAASTVWASPIRYWDKTISIPSGIFSTTPRLIVSSQSNQYWVGGASASSATAGTARVLTVATGSMAVNLSIYAVSG